jgi:hypothetical protein
VEHELELVDAPTPGGWQKTGCHWNYDDDFVAWNGAPKYMCNHVWLCKNCGKNLKATRPEDCPYYTKLIILGG